MKASRRLTAPTQQLWPALCTRETKKEMRKKKKDGTSTCLDVRVCGHSGFLGRRFDLVDFHFCAAVFLATRDWRNLSFWRKLNSRSLEKQKKKKWFDLGF